ncbi:hypothetical protein PLESTB_000931500 [Pleodorina starrii]|uniref:Uncharacterized protein n=1 Tax=Pleodorina starrii TaxID=330485 RepID=A0A9W6F3F6_9CHLO|nr:hypothetical protein PLESTM_001553700 [Pleodorina starrii]GLC55017.1 hypothetical protein PLESTB_000931500 [Pleodorina starrii]GLC68418.1 hypothetical protein PLESTF_000689400 [Pleodorina starrii]
MSSVDRVAYMDNTRSSQITEQINREKDIQRKYFQEQEAAGRIVPKPPTPPPERKSLLETVGIPEHVKTIKQDPEQALSLSISKHTWKANPGYLVRDGPSMASVMKKDFTWDEEEIQLMKEQGLLDKKFNRRRDEFVDYSEASARMIHLKKGSAPSK